MPPPSVAVAPPASTEPTPEALAALDVVTVTIESPQAAREAALYLRHVREHIRRVEARWKATRKLITDALAGFTALKQDELAPYAAKDALLAEAIADWDTREEVRLKAEADAVLAAAEAEARRRREVQVENLRAAAASAPTVTESKALTRQMRSVERAPITPVVTHPVEEAERLDGVYTTDEWTAEVYDAAVLVHATSTFLRTGKGGPPLAAVLPNQKWLDEQARSLRQDFAVPGVRAVKSKTVSARRVP